MSGGDPTTRYREVERKFDVPGAGLPSFDGVAAVAGVDILPRQALDAVYFDTPGRDLAANKITLRRRTGGPDAGWHLKLPAGPEARTEVRVPLDAGAAETVPAELRDVVAAVVRDRPLAPVARIVTERDVQLLRGPDGTVLAEFCDDHVTASAGSPPEVTEQRWREWELELVDAGPDLLDRLSRRLLSAGAAPAAHGSKLARALGAVAPAATPDRLDPVHRAVAEQVAELLVWDRGVRADDDDAVHQMRVTIRRLRSLLQGSAQTFGLAGDDVVLDELRWLAGLLGVARDAEVLAQRYRAALDELAPELVRGRVTERLVDGAAARYQTGRRAALIAMCSPRYFRLLDRLDAVVARPAGGVPAAVSGVQATVGTAYRRVRKAVKAAARAAGDANRDEALHRIRKGAKRLRYIAAATNAPAVADRAKAIQTLLGDHQDSVVSRAHLLQETAAARAAGEDTFSYGLLYQQEEDLARSCHAQLDSALRELDAVVRDPAGSGTPSEPR